MEGLNVFAAMFQVSVSRKGFPWPDNHLLEAFTLPLRGVPGVWLTRARAGPAV